MNFPVDFVWTSCSSWNDRAMDRYPHKGRSIIVKCYDLPDLMYSMRSAHANASWYRNMVLILSDDDRVPDFLKGGKVPRLRIVRHSDFIPAQYLATFNSNVIESYIHKIHGLSEHFVYFNDDTYICKPTSWKHFFTTDGRPINRHCLGSPDHSLEPHPFMFVKMMQNAIKAYGMHHTRYQHNVQPFQKSLIKRYEKRFKPELERYSSNRYRSPNDFNLLRFTTCFSTSEGVAAYKQTGDAYDGFYEAGDSSGMRRLLSSNRRTLPRFLCINNSTPETNHLVQSVVSRLFPVPIPSEKLTVHNHDMHNL